MHVASMKALPRRKGNQQEFFPKPTDTAGLNESPSQKEGKFRLPFGLVNPNSASMKALPKRKGNTGPIDR